MTKHEHPSTPHDNFRWWTSEDWLAVWCGGVLLSISLGAVLLNTWATRTGELTTDAMSAAVGSPTTINPLSQWLGKPARWSRDPRAAFTTSSGTLQLRQMAGVFISAFLVFGCGAKLRGQSLQQFAGGFAVVFLLTTLALVLAAQQQIKQYNLEYALWALAIGLLISNTVGTPKFVRPAVQTEFYIKTGLVLLGAKVLFGKLMQLGPPGLCVAWVVTPVVLVTTYWFGQRILKIPSKSLNMVISADMSVCGVSAAIATAAACKAKKEELSLTIGISLSFTVVMMVVMPWIIHATEMNTVVGGAWMGGTIDSTGAVAAAGQMVGPEAEAAAVTIKMIQNILIGVTAFGVALYWVRYVERGASDVRPDAWEIWRRFPKFVIGFLCASAVFSALESCVPGGPDMVNATLKGGTEIWRTWFFGLAFVSIGLESNFRELGHYLHGGKPLWLYACGQSLNLTLTLLMAWMMFS